MVGYKYKEDYLDLFELYRPKWFPDCYFCFGFWNGVVFGLILFLCGLLIYLNK